MEAIMGEIIGAKCENCNFKKKNMYLGSGIFNCREYAAFPYYCNKCKKFFVGNYKDQNLSCPTCQSKNIILYNDPQFRLTKEKKPIKESLFNLENDVKTTSKSYTIFSWSMETSFFILTNEYYKCPKCNQFSMKFNCIALYD